MVMYKNVNGQDVLLTVEEEQEFLDRQQAAIDQQPAIDAWLAWQAATPSEESLNLNVVSALVNIGASSPIDAGVLTFLNDLLIHYQSKPAQPEGY